MDYSSLFASGLGLPQSRAVSLDIPRPSAPLSSLSASQVPVGQVDGTKVPLRRRRRSSLTIATSPFAAIKSPSKAATQSLSRQLLSPTKEGWKWSAGLSARPPKALAFPKPPPTVPLPALPFSADVTPKPNHHRLPPSLILLPTSPPSAPSPLVLGTPLHPLSKHPSQHLKNRSLTGALRSRSGSVSATNRSVSDSSGRSRSDSIGGRSPLSPFSTNSPSHLQSVFKLDLNSDDVIPIPIKISTTTAFDSYFDIVKPMEQEKEDAEMIL